MEFLHLIGAHNADIGFVVGHGVFTGGASVGKTEVQIAMRLHEIGEVIIAVGSDSEVHALVQADEHTEFDIRRIIEHTQMIGLQFAVSGRYREVLHHAGYIAHRQVVERIMNRVLHYTVIRQLPVGDHRNTDLDTCRSRKSDNPRPGTELKGDRDLHHVDILVLMQFGRRRGDGVIIAVVILGVLRP